MAAFRDLDKALRWLRLQARRKQSDVASAAGITQAMLCSYEQGKRMPSLKSLEKILDALEIDLATLSEVLRLVRQGPSGEAGAGGDGSLPPFPGLPEAAGNELEPPSEEALHQMVYGFYQWLRAMKQEKPGEGASPSA